MLRLRLRLRCGLGVPVSSHAVVILLVFSTGLVELWEGRKEGRKAVGGREGGRRGWKGGRLFEEIDDPRPGRIFIQSRCASERVLHDDEHATNSRRRMRSSMTRLNSIDVIQCSEFQLLIIYGGWLSRLVLSHLVFSIKVQQCSYGCCE